MTERERSDPRPSALGALVRRLARIAQRAVDASSTWVLGAVLIAIAPGVFLWGVRHPGSLALHFVDNRLPAEDRQGLLLRVAGSFIVVAAAYVIGLWRAHAAHGRWDPAAPGRLNRALAFLVAPVLSLALFVPGFPAEHRYVVLILAVIAAGCVGTSAASLAPLVAPTLASLAARVRPLRYAVPLAVVGLAGLYAWGAIRLELAQHRGLRTGAYDLGIYTNIFWQSLHGNWLGCSFIKGGNHASAHFDPILIALSPTMLIHRGAETLIVIQGLWTASGAIPVYLLAARTGGRGFGLALAVAFLAHPALHGVSTFDFHSMGLSIPFVVWAVYFLERGSLVGYAIAIGLLLLCREDMAIAASCIGLYAIAAHRRARLGAVTIAVAALYLASVKLFAMPDPALLMRNSEQSYEYGSYFSGLSGTGGVGGILASLFANPVYVVMHLFKEARVFYVAVLLVPLAFLPLLAGRRWVLLGYGMIFILLTSREAAYSIGFHYAATALPGLFALTPAGAARLAAIFERTRSVPREQTFAGLGAAIVVAGLFVSAAFGAFLPNASFKAGFYPLVRELDARQQSEWEAFVELTRAIPPDAPLTASGFALPHFAARERLYHLSDVDESDWVVVRTNGLARHETEGLRALRRDTARWELVGERGGTVVFRRRR